MAPLAAIFIADYYVAKQKRIDVAALYMGENGRYWYKGGWNVAGVIAWILAFIIPLAGNTVMYFYRVIICYYTLKKKNLILFIKFYMIFCGRREKVLEIY